MRRLLSLWLPDFAIEAARRADESAGTAPFALLSSERGRLLLAAVDPQAAAAGLAPGQTLAAARTLLPELATRPEQPAESAAALAQLARWCGRYTPWVALDPASQGGGGAGLFLDISGCAHLFGGEAALAQDLLQRLARSGHAARLAVAATPGAAWALARHAADGRRPAVLLPPDDDIAAALAPLPAAALRLPGELLELLARLGLQRVGQLLGLPPAGLAPRFGPLLSRRLRQALGRLEEPIGPAQPERRAWVLRRFAEPLVAAGDLEQGLRLLLEELAELLERRGEGARRLEFVGHRVDGQQSAIVIGLGRPSRDPAHLAKLFAPKLERLDPGFGFESLALIARRSEAMAADQGGLRLLDRRPPRLPAAPAPRATREAAETPALAQLIDRLQNRLGEGTVRRLESTESHWPETAVRAAVPLAAASSPARGAGAQSGGRRTTRWTGLPRPLFLLRRAEPLEVVGPLSEGGVPRAVTWRRRRLQLVGDSGPERLLPPWWQPERAGEAARDYWQVEDGEGRRWWIYRALETASPEPAALSRPARWFLHGLFA